MTTARKFLSIKELRERELILLEEIRLIREEIQRREESGDLSAPSWRTSAPKMTFPQPGSRKEEKEEEERARFGNEANKALILLSKAKIKAGIEETLMEKRKKKVIPRSLPQEETAAEISED
jgi:hypothetical protein